MKSAVGLALKIMALLLTGVFLSMLCQYVDGLRSGRSGASNGRGDQRVVVLTPAITEMICALGQGGAIVAVGDYCRYPPEIRDRPKIGGYLNPNLEKIMALRPDWVIVQGRNPRLTAFCEVNRINIRALEITDIQSIYQCIDQLGQHLNCRDRARRLSADLRHRLAVAARRVAQHDPVPVFLCVGRAQGRIANLTTVGAGSFLSELLTMAGGVNVYGDLAAEYPQVSIESLIRRQPAVIIDLQPGTPLRDDQRLAIMNQWQALPTLTAAGTERVAIMTEDYVLIPGPRIHRIVRDLCAILHP